MFEEPEEKGSDLFEAKPVTADAGPTALKTNIDPRTGAKPKGNKALRDFRAEMQDVVSRETKVPPNAGPRPPKSGINHVGKDQRHSPRPKNGAGRGETVSADKGMAVPEPRPCGRRRKGYQNTGIGIRSPPGPGGGRRGAEPPRPWRRQPLDQKGLTAIADKAFGGTAGQGVHDPRRVYDAMETGINQHIAASGWLRLTRRPRHAKAR
jgi:hypothetical protein